jgi:hypothetical protein
MVKTQLGLQGAVPDWQAILQRAAGNGGLSGYLMPAMGGNLLGAGRASFVPPLSAPPIGPVSGPPIYTPAPEPISAPASAPTSAAAAALPFGKTANQWADVEPSSDWTLWASG